MYNKATKELKELINKKNETFESRIISLTATRDTDYSLWKITKNLSRPQIPVPPIQHPDGKWAKTEAEKAEILARYLEEVFQPNDNYVNTEIEEYLNQSQDSGESYQTYNPGRG